MLVPHDPRSPSSFPPPRCGHSFIFPRAVGAERTWQEPTNAPEGQAQCSLLFLFLLTPPANPPLSSQGQGQCLLLECSFKCALLPRLHVFPLSHPPHLSTDPSFGNGSWCQLSTVPCCWPSSAPTPRKSQCGPHPGGSPANNTPLPRKQWGACYQFWGASAALNGS